MAKRPPKKHPNTRWVVALGVLSLFAFSCADPEPTEYLGDGSLGVVEVAPGESIQIRSINTTNGDIALLGNSVERATAFAVEDYGPIHGFGVDLGTGFSDLCSREGGMISGSVIAADPRVVGVIGTRCSIAAVDAAPFITGAGLVMISASNTSPSLTSDLAGNEAENHFPGYYRTAHNDLIQGEATAHFFNEIGIGRAAVIHDGGPYTMGLATAFSDAFVEHGGTLSGIWQVERTETDLVPVLTEIAQTNPDALFFPLFMPIGGHLIMQVTEMPALSGTVLAGADGLLSESFLSIPESEGMYISGPDARFGENANQITGWKAPDLIARFEETTGEPPTGFFWGHGYDATILLLDAIAAASYINPDTEALVIDRAGVRLYLDNLSGFEGVTGVLHCDQFGDCGASAVAIHHHLDSTDPQATRDNVVFELGPDTPGNRESLTEH